jgi:hypothetical protein
MGPNVNNPGLPVVCPKLAAAPKVLNNDTSDINDCPDDLPIRLKGKRQEPNF